MPVDYISKTAPSIHCGSVTDVLKPLIGPRSGKRPPQHHSDRVLLMPTKLSFQVSLSRSPPYFVHRLFPFTSNCRVPPLSQARHQFDVGAPHHIPKFDTSPLIRYLPSSPTFVPGLPGCKLSLHAEPHTFPGPVNPHSSFGCPVSSPALCCKSYGRRVIAQRLVYH